MALSDSSHVAAIADNRLLTMAAKIAVAFGTPVIIAVLSWVALSLIGLDERVAKLETTVSLSIPNIYPRPEAVQAFATVNAITAGLKDDVRSNTHRIGALEDARERGLH